MAACLSGIGGQYAERLFDRALTPHWKGDSVQWSSDWLTDRMGLVV